jgi:hypothetical protein
MEQMTFKEMAEECLKDIHKVKDSDAAKVVEIYLHQAASVGFKSLWDKIRK